MKIVHILLLLLGISSLANAQEKTQPRPGLPLTVSLFSESVSLPNFKNLLKGGIGIRVGTELYYRNRPGHQFIQTLNVGYYFHPRLQSGLYVNSEVGYRKFIGNFYTEAFLGGGALGISSRYPSYKRSASGEYQKAPQIALKFMPSASVGVGYRFNRQTTVFTRYEVFGEMPFSQILLPHKAIHVGTKLSFDK
jgi:hypothetical protein